MRIGLILRNIANVVFIGLLVAIWLIILSLLGFGIRKLDLAIQKESSNNTIIDRKLNLEIDSLQTNLIISNSLTIDSLKNEINTIKSDLFEAEKECIESRENLGEEIKWSINS